MRRFNQLEDDEQAAIGAFIMGMITALFLIAAYLAITGESL